MDSLNLVLHSETDEGVVKVKPFVQTGSWTRDPQSQAQYTMVSPSQAVHLDKLIIHMFTVNNVTPMCW